jgi:hypothetical protein
MVYRLMRCPVPLPGLRITGYAADEEERLRLLVQDQDFLHATNRQEQIAIIGIYFRRFVAGRRMTLESIGRFLGVRPAVIQAKSILRKALLAHLAVRRCYPLQRKSGLKI